MLDMLRLAFVYVNSFKLKNVYMLKCTMPNSSIVLVQKYSMDF